MKRSTQPLALLLWLTLVPLATAPAQTPKTTDGYNAATALSRAGVLRADPRQETGPSELERLCGQALAHQDVPTLCALACIDPGNVRMQVLRGLPAQPLPVQRQVLVAVLQDDRLWNYDRVHHFTQSGFREGQYSVQLEVRGLVGEVLGRDLRRESKYYDPDRRKQAKAEAAATIVEASILDVATREQLIATLSAQ